MKKHAIVSILEGFGYTEKETKTYLAALECGTAPASEIGKKSTLNRVTTYETLKKLSQKGLITVFSIKDIKHFTPINPQKFFENAEQKMNDLKKAIPFLTSLLSPQNQNHTVQLFEGVESLKKAYEETLKSKTEIFNYANSRNIRDHWPEYDIEYVQKRAEKKVFLRGIAPDDSYGRKVQKEDEKYFRITRLLPKSLFWVENEINIFDDKMLIASFEPTPFAILIQSQTAADTQRQIFNLAWHGYAEK